MTHKIFVLMLIFFFTIQCTKTDTVSKASDAHKVKLPQQKGAYEVLGEIPGIHNFVVKYDNNIYRGGEITSTVVSNHLKAWKIRTIVSMSVTEQEKEVAKQLGIDLIEIDLEKTKGLDKQNWEKYLSTLQEENYPLFIHCHGGSHRAGILGLIYRVQVLGWPLESSIDEYVKLGGDREKDKIMIKSVHKFLQ